jgi:putative redox protein
MDANVTWKGGMSFDGKADSGFVVPLGTDPAFGGNNDGFKPLELMAVSLAGCTAMDVISILQKKQQKVSEFVVKVHVDRVTDHPRIFEQAVIEYVVTGQQIDRSAVERAVELSETKYCPAQAMLSKAFPINHLITIIDQ